MVSLNWLKQPYVKAWLTENPSVQTWLDKSERIQTQTNNGNYLYKFCQTVGETPETLRRLRYATDERKLAEFRKKHNLTPPEDAEEGPDTISAPALMAPATEACDPSRSA